MRGTDVRSIAYRVQPFRDAVGGKRKKRSEISVFGNQDSLLCGRQRQQLGVFSALQSAVADMGGVVAGSPKPAREAGR